MARGILCFLFICLMMLVMCAPHAQAVTLIMLWSTPGYSKPGHIEDSTPNTEAQCHAKAAEWKRLLEPAERKTVHYECRP